MAPYTAVHEALDKSRFKSLLAQGASTHCLHTSRVSYPVYPLPIPQFSPTIFHANLITINHLARASWTAVLAPRQCPKLISNTFRIIFLMFSIA